MHGIIEDWKNWVDACHQYVKDINKTRIVLCTPSAAFSIVGKQIGNVEDSCVFLGAQSIHHLEQGAYSGEISLPMLQCFGGKYTLVGHSEYRKMHNIQACQLREQMKASLRHDVMPILCIGESHEERRDGKTVEVLESQLEDALGDIHFSKASALAVAYEPVWGISSVASKTPEPDDVKDVFRFIRSWLVDRYGDIAEDIPLLYGGSVDAENVVTFMENLGINGVLVGSASLKSDVFQDIVRRVDEF